MFRSARRTAALVVVVARLVLAIHAWPVARRREQDVDARDKRGRDGL